MRQITCGVSEDIGWRFRMENAHALVASEEQEFFAAGVFDGHIDPLAAQAAADVLHRFLQGSLKEESQKPAEERRSVAQLIKQAYIDTDQYIIDRSLRSGTAAATLYLVGDDFWAANAGDCRIVMCSEDGPKTLSQDHRPDLPVERDRIESLGGKVMYLDVPRVEGDLALSRALGDVFFKPYVTPLPRINHGSLGRNILYAILACDGVWATLSVEEACSIVKKAASPQKAAEKVQQEAFFAGSDDNITVIVLDLKEYARQAKHEKMVIHSVIDTALD